MGSLQLVSPSRSSSMENTRFPDVSESQNELEELLQIETLKCEATDLHIHEQISGANTKFDQTPQNLAAIQIHLLTFGEKHVIPSEEFNLEIGSPSNYAPNSLPRMNFPIFDGSNPRAWILQCTDYFKLMPSVSDVHMIDLAIWNFEGRAFSWILELPINDVFALTWPQFCEVVCTSFESLTDKRILDAQPMLFNRIFSDKADNSLTIIDNGIGMIKDDLVKNLDSVTRYGTKKFMDALSVGADVSMNGQFGVGFSSAYLVVEKVIVPTKHNDDVIGIAAVKKLEELGNILISWDPGVSIVVAHSSLSDNEEQQDVKMEYLVQPLFRKEGFIAMKIWSTCAMLKKARWPVEYWRRLSKDFQDAVYIVRERRTYCSVTLIYWKLKERIDNGKAVDNEVFASTPIPNETLRLLFKVTEKGKEVGKKKKVTARTISRATTESSSKRKSSDGKIKRRRTLLAHHRVTKARGSAYLSKSCDDVLNQLVQGGISPAEFYDTVCKQEVELALTAHATQINWRILQYKHIKIVHLLEYNDQPDLGHEDREMLIEDLVRELASIRQTDALRLHKPTPVDEARAGLNILEQLLWRVVPHYLRRLSIALKKHSGKPLPLTCTPIKFGSWIRGDRDGNPNVTAKVTRDVSLFSKWMAVDLYLREVDNLRFELSMNRCSATLSKLAHDILEQEQTLDSWQQSSMSQFKHHNHHTPSLPTQLPAGAAMLSCAEHNDMETHYPRLDVPGSEFMPMNRQGRQESLNFEESSLNMSKVTIRTHDSGNGNGNNAGNGHSAMTPRGSSSSSNQLLLQRRQFAESPIGRSSFQKLLEPSSDAYELYECDSDAYDLYEGNQMLLAWIIYLGTVPLGGKVTYKRVSFELFDTTQKPNNIKTVVCASYELVSWEYIQPFRKFSSFDPRGRGSFLGGGIVMYHNGLKDNDVHCEEDEEEGLGNVSTAQECNLRKEMGCRKGSGWAMRNKSMRPKAICF